MAVNNAMLWYSMKYKSHALENQTGEHPAYSPTLLTISNSYLIQIGSFKNNMKF